MTATLPNFYVTGVAKALTGEAPCLLEPWFKARKLMPKREESDTIVQWKVRHTELLHAEVARLKAAGWKCQVERYFRLKGQTAYISGKPDIVAQREGSRPTVIDVKGGEQKAYYLAQVGLYMAILPLAWDRPEWIFDGEVVYDDDTRVRVPPVSATLMRPKAFALVKRLATEQPPASPGEQTCRFCDATTEMCPEKIGGAYDGVTTELF